MNVSLKTLEHIKRTIYAPVVWCCSNSLASWLTFSYCFLVTYNLFPTASHPCINTSTVHFMNVTSNSCMCWYVLNYPMGLLLLVNWSIQNRCVVCVLLSICLFTSQQYFMTDQAHKQDHFGIYCPWFGGAADSKKLTFFVMTIWWTLLDETCKCADFLSKSGCPWPFYMRYEHIFTKIWSFPLPFWYFIVFDLNLESVPSDGGHMPPLPPFPLLIV